MMKTKVLIKLFTIIFLLGIVQFVSGQESDSALTLTLQQAQEYAVLNNLEKKNAELDILAAKRKVWETTAIGLPQIEGSVNYQYIPGDLPTINFGSSTAMFDPILGLMSGLHTNPAEAAMIQGFIDELEAQEEAQEPMSIAQKNSATYSLSVSQLVFSGEYIVGLQAARTYKQISEISDQQKAQEVKQNTASSYFAILTLEKNLEIIDSTIQNMTTIVGETKAMFNEGLMASTDVDQLQLTLNTLQNSQKAVKRQVDVSYKLFKILLNIGFDQNVHLSEGLEAIKDNHVHNILQKTDFNVENTIDYKLIANQENVSRLNLKRQRAAALPSVAAFYQYQDKINAPDIDFSIKHILGLNVTVPIFSSGQRWAKVQQAKIELQKSRNTKVLVEQNIKMQESQARNDFNTAMEKYNYEEANMNLSKRILAHTTEKYKQGVVSSMDLTQATNQYLNSYSKMNSALMELLNAKVKYDKLLNNL